MPSRFQGRLSPLSREALAEFISTFILVVCVEFRFSPFEFILFILTASFYVLLTTFLFFSLPVSLLALDQLPRRSSVAENLAPFFLSTSAGVSGLPSDVIGPEGYQVSLLE